MKINVSESPYGLNREEKKKVLGKRLRELSDYHRRQCLEYLAITKAVNSPMPMLPVGLFKEISLSSTGENHKTIMSSGTTGQKRSQVIIDGETAALQQMALASIGTDFLGPKRLPMLVIDCPQIITDRNKYSARTAAILGFSIFGSRRTFALNEDMSLNAPAVTEFLEKWGREPFLVFGFTYIIWQYFYNAKSSWNMENGILVHGGGWKKLQELAVSHDEFKDALKSKYHIRKVHDYYGMAEQAGSIFMECSEGYFHCSDFSEVMIRRPSDFSEAGPGEEGLIQVMSALPESYPGHNLLTEDEGILIGEDDCPCGRKGRYFTVTGRTKEAELRGCSDTRKTGEAQEGSELRYILGGEVSGCALKAFDPKAVEFLENWARIIRESNRDTSDSAFAFWIRKTNLDHMAGQCFGKSGLGRCFMLTPSNIPALWAYNLALAVMTGNTAIIRLPQSMDENSNLINTLKTAIEAYPFWKGRIALVKYGHDKTITDAFSRSADLRVIWGGNDSIREIQKSSIKPGGKDITFPTRHSLGIIDSDEINEGNIDAILHSFYNDTYMTDQNACSSPNVLVWRGKNYGIIRQLFWRKLHDYLGGRYEVSGKSAVNKWQKAMALAAEGRTERIDHEGNAIVRAWISRPDKNIWNYSAPGGFFMETDGTPECFISDVVQTAAFYGCEPEPIEGIRSVPGGHALDFSYFWDGVDLLKEMTENERNN